MCFFGAPLPLPDHRARALLSALDHLRVVDSIRERWGAQGRPLINCRIGVNTGEVVVGNIGSRDGQDYTVIGDAVNLASRLEGANKEYGTRLMVSESSLVGCEAIVEARELDFLRVKGKSHGVRVFEVLGETGKVSETALRLRDSFVLALGLYRTMNFREADDAFAACQAIVLDDGPSRAFRERCRYFLANPPAAGWDGVWEMHTK